MRIDYKTVAIVLLTTVLNGCYVSSPYHGQVFSSRTELIPVQIWSPRTNGGFRTRIECHRATQGGLHEPLGEYTWQQINSYRLELSLPLLDSGGNLAYASSTDISLPDRCWHREYVSGIPTSRTALRFKERVGFDSRGAPQYRLAAVFDKLGLACAGQAIGETGLWSGFLNRDCYPTFENSSQALTFLIIETPN